MSDEKHEWQCIADLMAVLMVIFLFISVVYLISPESNEVIEQASVKIKTVSDKNKESLQVIENAFTNRDKELNDALRNKFQEVLSKWKATIEEDNSIKFNSPKMLFKGGESELSQDFKDFLDKFCPQYVDLLATKFIEEIIEIRIEGHTSSDWPKAKFDKRYIKNLELSQHRAYAVLVHCYEAPKMPEKHKVWLTEKLRANGMSFAQRVMENGVENRQKSRRVEFRVITKETPRGDVYTDTIQPGLEND